MKIMLIGLGRWGMNHLRVWNDLKQDVYVAEMDSTALDAALEHGGDKNKITTDYHEFLDQVDAVSIVTPTDTHFKIAEDCIKAGKDVFIEKPLCMNPTEAKQLNGLVKANNTILQVGHIFRFNPVSEYIKSMLQRGELGTIRYLYGTFKGFKRARTDVGVTQTDSIHFFDLFNYFLGSRPTAVTAITRDFLGRGLDDLSFVVLEYDKILAYIESSYFSPGQSRDVTIVGDKKLVSTKITAQQIEVHNKHHQQVSGIWQAVDEGVDIPKIITQEPLYLELKHFVECVETKKQPSVGIESGYTSLKIVDAAYTSSREGRKIEIEYEDL